MIEDGKLVEPGSSDYDEIVTTKEAETIDAFSSQVIHAKTKTAHLVEGINVMTHALHVEDASLPQGLTLQNAYTELHSGSKNIALIVRNNMAYPQTLRKKTPMARAVTVTQIPELPVLVGSMEASEDDQGQQIPKLTVKQRQEKLFEEQDLIRLEFWPPELAAIVQSFLAEYHDIFSLEPSKHGCTHPTKHVIKVTDDT